MQLFMPAQGYFEAMDFTQKEWNNAQILNHIFHGLDIDGLIESNWRFGNQRSLKEIFSHAPSNGIICIPSSLGVELLLWAFGHGDKQLDFLLTDDFSAEIEGIPTSVSNAVAIKNN